jgi:Tol biopolymer transport system component
VISTLAGEFRKLVDDGFQGAFSPDGSRVAFRKDDDLWLMRSNGDEPQRFMSIENGYDVRGPKWSPDGRRLLYLKNRLGGTESSIEARPIAGGSTDVLYSGTGLLDFWWTSDGRLIYSQAVPSEQATYDLWELPMNITTARRTGEPRRLTRWVGYSPGFVSVSADGKRIITTKGYTQSDVYVAELEANAARLKGERPITSDTRSDWPTGWTKDGKTILFFSDRNGSFDIFRQMLSAPAAEPIVSSRGDARAPQISPDGQWLLYMVWPEPKPGSTAGPVRLMRLPLAGGSSTAVLETGGAFASGITFSFVGEQDTQGKGGRMFPDFRCPSSPRALCVLAEAEQNQVVFTSFDPIGGRKTEAAHVRIPPARLFWDLSPDGSHIAYGQFYAGEGEEIMDLTIGQGTARQIPLKGWTNLNSLSWSADGRSLFVTTSRREGSDMLHVDLDGKVKWICCANTGRWVVDPRPSPDGRFLTYAVRTVDSNVWLIENGK